MGQPGGIVVHDFQQKLRDSQTLSDEPCWLSFYERVWPKQILCAVRIDKDSIYQRWGVDREVKLVTGQNYTIDEKKRTGEKDWGDMLIEEWSVFYGDGDKRNKVGWTLDRTKRCDFIAYAVVAVSKCYLLPFDLLRRTTQMCLADWKQQAGAMYPRDSKNRGYVTRNCPVRWDRLWADMRRVSEQSFTAAIALPKAIAVSDQIIFQYDKPATPAVVPAKPLADDMTADDIVW